MEYEEITKNTFYCCKHCLSHGTLDKDVIVSICPICSSKNISLYPSEYEYIKATSRC